MGKKLLPQFGMLIELQPSYDQTLKVLNQKVGEIKCPQLLFSKRGKLVFSSKKRVTVRARQPLNIFFGQKLINLTTGPAIAIGDKNMLILAPIFGDLCPQFRRYQLRGVV